VSLSNRTMNGFHFFLDGSTVPRDYARFCEKTWENAKGENDCLLTGEQLATALYRMILERP